jgi:hypothetical protein
LEWGIQFLNTCFVRGVSDAYSLAKIVGAVGRSDFNDKRFGISLSTNTHHPFSIPTISDDRSRIPNNSENNIAALKNIRSLAMVLKYGLIFSKWSTLLMKRSAPITIGG